jgi:hypothetical protein
LLSRNNVTSDPAFYQSPDSSYGRYADDFSVWAIGITASPHSANAGY